MKFATDWDATVQKIPGEVSATQILSKKEPSQNPSAAQMSLQLGRGELVRAVIQSGTRGARGLVAVGGGWGGGGRPESGNGGGRRR